MRYVFNCDGSFFERLLKISGFLFVKFDVFYLVCFLGVLKNGICLIFLLLELCVLDVDECFLDWDCFGNWKCCLNGCYIVCVVFLVVLEKD